MKRVYVGNDFRITLTGLVDMTGGSAVMKYVRPDGVTGERAVDVLDYSTARCRALFTSDENTEPGQWRFWLKVTFADATEAEGDAFRYAIIVAGG